MTLEKAIQEVWEQLGEPSDLDPYVGGVISLTAPGAELIRNALNDAQDVAATWIGAGGRRSRFRVLEDRLTWEPLLFADTFGAQGSRKTLALPAAFAAIDSLRDFVLVVNGEQRRVVRNFINTGTSYVVLDRSLEADPSGATFTLHQRVFSLADLPATGYDGRIIEVLEIVDLELQSSLELAAEDEDFTASSATVGVPSLWKKSYNSVNFDVGCEDARTYETIVMRYPTQLAALTDSFELPDAYVQAVVLRATWWGYRRMEEFNAAYATKRDFEDLMSRLRNQVDLESERGGDYFRVRSR